MINLHGNLLSYCRECAGFSWRTKVIGHTSGAQALLDRAGVKLDVGIVSLPNDKAVSTFITAARNGRIWDREPSLRRPG
jgi:catalase